MSNATRYRRWAIIFFWAAFALFPVYWMGITAFKDSKDIFDGPFVLPFVDFQPSLQAWEFLLGEGRDQFLTGLVNSTIFAVLGAFFAVLIGAFAAYGLARYQYRYGPAKNNDVSFFIVSQRMMPPIVAVIALFAIFRFLGQLDTHLGMILIYTWFSLPLTVFLLTEFMGRIPVEIEQAAAIDGYGKMQQILRVVLPLASPGLAAAFLLSFFFIWNDFLLALMLTFKDAQTLPLIITSWSAQMEPRWWLIAAAGLIAIIPPAIAAVILDRYMDRQVLRGGTR